MSNSYDDFLNRYRIRDIRVSRDYSRINYYNSSYSFKADREEVLDIEIDRSAFEHLVKLDSRYEEMAEKERSEHWLRRQHPAVAEAYSKYQMLLELYR